MQFKQQYKEGEKTKDDWETPDYIFNPLDKVFDFRLDAAANRDNALCTKYYSLDNSGLENPWDENTFCNPPYSDGQYAKWINKAVEEFIANGPKFDYALLLPASWETVAFESVWSHARYFIFPYKRIRFELGGESIGGAPFSSLIPVFTKVYLNSSEIGILSDVGRVVDLDKGYRCLP